MSRLGGRPAENIALLALVGFTLVALAGYWNFALHPERLAAFPGALDFYSTSYQFFARSHIVLSSIVLGLVLIGRLGLQWLPALLAVYLLSFVSEHVGTGFGIPFGGYGYTAMLGAKLGGRVPLLIPLSWFLMAFPSWLLARHAVGAKAPAMIRVFLGALWLTVWDLALDPAMSHLTSYWIWEETGPYYGMPWMNLVGWYATGIVLMTALEGTTRRLHVDALPVGWIGAYYGVVALMPLGMLVAAGEWLAVGVSLAGLAFAWHLGRALGRMTPKQPVLADDPADGPAPEDSDAPRLASMGAR